MQYDNPENLPTIAIFDLDSTITRKDTYLAFLISLLLAKPWRLTRCLHLPVAIILHKTGLRNNSWLKAIFLRAIAGGLDRNNIEVCADRFLNKLQHNGLRPGALRAIQQHRQAGHQLVLATASFDFYTEKLARKLGFNQIICTHAEWSPQGKLTGMIAGVNCYGTNKLQRLNEHFGRQREQFYLIGYSDHHSDAAFLNWVDRGIAVNPTRKLKQLAGQSHLIVYDWENMIQ